MLNLVFFFFVLLVLQTNVLFFQNVSMIIAMEEMDIETNNDSLR